jgi:predicted MFS family arabinose efflux permease
MTLAAAPTPTGEAGVYARPLLWMLALAYACNFMDRSVVGTLAQAIKVDLLLNDSQLGLLQGFAFVVLYAGAGLPMAWLAERRDRINIISICLVVWSGMTMVCGLAQNFPQLLLARVGVGIGEAGCNPCSHSMIADAFAPGDRSRALSIYQLGATVGTMIGAMSAGLIAQHFGWRVAFVTVGVPGILIAIAMKLTMKDPGRRASAHSTTSLRLDGALPVLKFLVTSGAIINLVLGFTLASFAFGAISGFTQPYFIRAFGLTVGQIGLIFGLSGGLASAACLIVSGRLTDWATRRSERWHAWLPTIGMTCAMPCILGAYSVSDWHVALGLTFLSGFFMNWFIIPTLSALHKLLGVRRVAVGMTLVLMFQNFLGLGAGPFVNGLVIDTAARRLYAAAGHGSFAAFCPGGAAPKGSPIEALQACHAALTGATRIGLMSTVLVLAWACLHYLAASRSLVSKASRQPPGGGAMTASA